MVYIGARDRDIRIQRAADRVAGIRGEPRQVTQQELEDAAEEQGVTVDEVKERKKSLERPETTFGFKRRPTISPGSGKVIATGTAELGSEGGIRKFSGGRAVRQFGEQENEIVAAAENELQASLTPKERVKLVNEYNRQLGKGQQPTVQTVLKSRGFKQTQKPTVPSQLTQASQGLFGGGQAIRDGAAPNKEFFLHDMEAGQVETPEETNRRVSDVVNYNPNFAGIIPSAYATTDAPRVEPSFDFTKLATTPINLFTKADTRVKETNIPFTDIRFQDFFKQSSAGIEGFADRMQAKAENVTGSDFAQITIPVEGGIARKKFKTIPSTAKIKKTAFKGLELGARVESALLKDFGESPLKSAATFGLGGVFGGTARTLSGVKGIKLVGRPLVAVGTVGLGGAFVLDTKTKFDQAQTKQEKVSAIAVPSMEALIFGSGAKLGSKFALTKEASAERFLSSIKEPKITETLVSPKITRAKATTTRPVIQSGKEGTFEVGTQVATKAGFEIESPAVIVSRSQTGSADIRSITQPGLSTTLITRGPRTAIITDVGKNKLITQVFKSKSGRVKKLAQFKTPRSDPLISLTEPNIKKFEKDFIQIPGFRGERTELVGLQRGVGQKGKGARVTTFGTEELFARAIKPGVEVRFTPMVDLIKGEVTPKISAIDIKQTSFKFVDFLPKEKPTKITTLPSGETVIRQPPVTEVLQRTTTRQTGLFGRGKQTKVSTAPTQKESRAMKPFPKLEGQAKPMTEMDADVAKITSGISKLLGAGKAKTKGVRITTSTETVPIQRPKSSTIPKTDLMPSTIPKFKFSTRQIPLSIVKPKSSTKPIVKPIQVPKQQPKLTQDPLFKQVTKPTQQLKQLLRPKQMLRPRQQLKQQLELIPRPRGGAIGTPRPIIPEIPLRGVPGGLPKLGLDPILGRRKKKKRGAKRPTRFQPSLFAAAEGIFGKAPKILTGLEIRPIRRRKKRKK